MLERSKSLSLPLLILFLSALLSAPVFADAMTEEFQQTYPLSADGTVSLENINGDVKIEAWDRDEVEVIAVKKGPDQAALDRVAIEIDASSNRVEIETEYKKESGERGWSGKQWASVDYTLRVPRQARLSEIELVNGSLHIHDLRGDIEASLVNGNVEASGLAGDLDLSTVNGKLDVSFDQLDGQQSVDLDSVNGSIVLSLGSASSADVKASTVHGPIRNDFGFEVDKGEYVGRSMHGRLGGGEASIKLNNVNGSITVRQGG